MNVGFEKKTPSEAMGGAIAPVAPPWLRHCDRIR